MTHPSDLAKIDQILDAFEREAESCPQSAAFVQRVLDSLASISGAKSASLYAMVCMPSGASASSLASSTSPSAPQPAESLWLRLSHVGGDLPQDIPDWLRGITLTDRGSLPNNHSLDHPRLCRRSGGYAYYAVGVSGDLGLSGAMVLAFAEPCPSAADDGIYALIDGFADVLAHQQRALQRSTAAELESTLDRFLAELYRSGTGAEFAACLAHDLPAVLRCQRVTVLRRALVGNWRVQAVTGAAQVAHRTELVVAIEDLVTEKLDLQRPIACRAPAVLAINSSGVAPPEGSSARNITEDQAADTLILPLALGTPSQRSHERVPVVVVLQWPMHESLVSNVSRVRRVVHHLITAGQRVQRQVPTISWRRPWALPYHLSSSRAWMGFVATLIGVGLIWASANFKVDFYIESMGQLEPVEQRLIFATHDSQVDEMMVDDGQNVVAGQVLIQLKSADLELRARELDGEIATALKRRDGLTIAMNQLNPNQADSLVTSRQLAAEIESLNVKLSGLRQLRDLLERQSESLQLHSPIRGTVITWDAKRNLESRPVRRGDALLKIAEVTGPWRLRLWVPDREMKHVREAFLQQPSLGEAGQDKISSPREADVQFRLISRPGENFYGTLMAIGNTVQMLSDTGPVVAVDFSINHQEVEGLQVNATTSGRIHCGQRPWWYVWSRTLIESLQRRFWISGDYAQS